MNAKLAVCGAADLDEMARLLAAVFTERDPPAVALGLTPAEFEAFVRLFCSRAAEEGLTIVARNANSGEMIGALLTEDSASLPPDGLERVSSKFNPIFHLLGQLDSEYRAGKTLRAGEILHLFLLGVDGRFGGHGVGQQLLSACLENGRKRRFRLAVTEATNRTSQHIFRKHGFVERVQGSYRDHRYEGKAFFESIVEHGGPILMDRILSAPML
jgi:ribosomal protein S18 acetylase RimI-like enzyme